MTFRSSIATAMLFRRSGFMAGAEVSSMMGFGAATFPFRMAIARRHHFPVTAIWSCRAWSIGAWPTRLCTSTLWAM